MKYNRKTNVVDSSDNFNDDLVHLARLALMGKQQDVELYVRRLSRKIGRSMPDVAQKLDQILGKVSMRQSPLRDAAVAVIPVDIESRLQLVRQEFPVILEVEPIWSDKLHEGLEQVIAERERQSELAEAEVLPTRSLLFTGLPGVGKTLAARWIAHKLQWPLITLDLSAVMSSFLGRTGNNLRNVLDYSKGINCVLLLDEFDAIAKRRDDAVEIGELKRLVTVLLQEIENWPTSGILIAATNHPDLLDPAVWRRFDMIFDFSMPTVEQVKEIFRNRLKQVEGITEEWVDIAGLTLRDLSFSDIERELFRVRREAVILNQSIPARLENLIKSRVESLPGAIRKEIAISLTALGYSQRQANKLTGVSRDTIRSGRK